MGGREGSLQMGPASASPLSMHPVKQDGYNLCTEEAAYHAFCQSLNVLCCAVPCRYVACVPCS